MHNVAVNGVALLNFALCECSAREAQFNIPVEAAVSSTIYTYTLLTLSSMLRFTLCSIPAITPTNAGM